MIHIYNNTVCEDTTELGDPYVRAPTQQEMKISERVVAYSSGDMDKVSCIY